MRRVVGWYDRRMGLHVPTCPYSYLRKEVAGSDLNKAEQSALKQTQTTATMQIHAHKFLLLKD
eukprot:scaffold1911_cov266-Chaetoceros_neogracile.AAC.18